MWLLRALKRRRKRGFGRFCPRFDPTCMLASVLEDASKLPCRGRAVRRCLGSPNFIYGDYGSRTTHATRRARVRISILRVVHNT